MPEVAHIVWMINVPPDTETPTYKESVSITKREGGSLASSDVKINGQENKFMRLACGALQC